MNSPAADLATADKFSCLVCGGEYRSSRLPGLFECANCAFVSADIAIPDEELAALYGADYFHGEEYLDYVEEEDSLVLNFRKRLPLLRRFVPDWKHSDLFEIGCAYGFFLKTVAAEVRRASGIDISADAVAHAKTLGLDARHGDYLTCDLGRKVDVITMWDTVEHLRRPDLFIRKAASDLKPGGVLAVTTGDIGSLNARLRGKRWRMIYPPTHLHYFSVRTLAKLLDRAGFDLIHVSHPGVSRKLSSILYIIVALQMGRQDLYAKLRRLPFLDWPITMNFSISCMYWRAAGDPMKGRLGDLFFSLPIRQPAFPDCFF